MSPKTPLATMVYYLRLSVIVLMESIPTRNLV